HSLYKFIRNRSVHFYNIFLFMLVSGAKYFIHNIALVCQQKQAITGFVQSSHRENAFGMFYEIHHIIIKTGIGGAGYSNGFVQHYENFGRIFRNKLSVNPNLIAGHYPIAQPTFFAVYGHAAFSNKSISFAARAKTAIADCFVEADGIWVVHYFFSKDTNIEAQTEKVKIDLIALSDFLKNCSFNKT